ncbi:MAG: hypothetical protein OES57_02815 [Acidimicrobiia bacterium]|nr:hypothetical protein [Acidimicrobiia bacterium]
MTQQHLHLDRTAPWRLDDTTRAVGRRGVAEARSALALARQQATAAHEHSLAA